MEFRNFRALFDNIVHHNAELSNVQKLYYLKQALTGSANLLVRDFELNDHSYSEAYSYFVNQYDNKLMVVRALFRKLMKIESIKNETKIQSLLDQIEVIIRGLKASGETVAATFSQFITYFVSTKLDPRTAKDWENSLTHVIGFVSAV